MYDLLLKNARVAISEAPVDIAITGERIAAIAPHLDEPATQTCDVAGRVVLPGLVESHIHLDKALTRDRLPNRSGTLAEAIERNHELSLQVTSQDIYTRAHETALWALRCGTTTLRTHVNVDPFIELYVLYSHSAADHSTGGAAFADTAQFVGQAKAAPRMAAFNDPATPPPAITFDKRHTVELGGTRVELHSADLSPTDDYFILHHPASRLVMTCDFVQPKNTPFRTLLGHPDQIVERLRWLHDSLDFDVLVTGHATPSMTGTKEDVLQQRQYYLDLSEAIEAARAKGCADASPEMVNAVRASLAPRYGSWRRFDEFLALNIEGMIGWRNGTIKERP